MFENFGDIHEISENKIFLEWTQRLENCTKCYDNLVNEIKLLYFIVELDFSTRHETIWNIEIRLDESAISLYRTKTTNIIDVYVQNDEIQRYKFSVKSRLWFKLQSNGLHRIKETVALRQQIILPFS